MKFAYILVALGISILVFAGIRHQQATHKNDSVIAMMTKSEAQIRKLCASDKIDSRIECMEPKFEKLALKDFPNRFSILQNGQRSQVDAVEFHNLMKIKRVPGMSFGGSCVSTFYYFDFDMSDFYISKDNLSGIILCQNGKNMMVISLSDLSEEALKNEVKTISGISL